MTRFLLYLSLALYFACLAHGAAQAESISLAKLRFAINESQYLFDVSDVQDDRGFSRKVRIACLEGCRPPQYVEELVGDTPLGVYRLTDSLPILITTWGTGSAYAIRIYRFGTGGIQKIFEGHSIGLPDVHAISREEIEVELTERPPKAPLGVLVKRTWRWKAPSPR